MSEKKRRGVRMLWLTVGLLGLGICLWLLATAGWGIPCLFHTVTGLMCPGCGNTRAAVALLRGDIGGSFAYNPLFLPEAAYLLWVYARAVWEYIRNGRFSYRTPALWLDIAALLVFLLWGILRNFI